MAEWKTDFLQAGAELLEALFTLQQKENEIRFFDSRDTNLMFSDQCEQQKALQRHFPFDIPI